MQHIGGTADEIRAFVPTVLAAYERTRDTVLRAGVVDHALKELCFGYLASGADLPPLDGRGDRERAALEWASAIEWDSGRADDALWVRLRALFSEPELVELGCAIGFELGYQHWRRTIGLAARD